MPASSQPASTSFDIQAQPLPAAIIQLSRQSGAAVIAPARLVGRLMAPAIRGTMTAEQALAALLAGSGLVARKNASNIYVIEPKPVERPRIPRAAPAMNEGMRPDDPSKRPEDAATDIVVTGSRITVAGYRAPTPVTVVDEAQIVRDAKTSIGDTIRELPQVGTSSSPNNGQGAGGIVAGTAGLDTVNLRQLGFLRTLILFDGQRVVQSNITGQVDIGTIPTMLVERIDVVTAGASAAWGSDAVSGVVNLILNKKFEGLKLSADYGDSDASDHRSYHVQLAAGSAFAGGRGHLAFAAGRSETPEIVFAGRRSWNSYPALVPNPAYTTTNGAPYYIHATKVGLSQATTGGLITAGPLQGIQFVGANATPAPFDFGQVSGPISTGGDAEQLNASLDNLTVAFRATNLFGHTSYRLADWLTLSLQLNYGATWSHNSSVPVTRFGTLTIQRDNAFLPEPIRDQMGRLGLSTIQVGTTNLNNLPSGKFTIDDLEGTTVAIPTAVTRRRLKRGVLSFAGDLGGGWSWNAYYERGEVRLRQDVINNLLPGNFNRAIDAVVAPIGNSAGLAPGTIVCRSTLSNPADGCAPLDIFGVGVASAAAIAYVNVKPGQNYQVQQLTESMLAASVQGVLPIGLPAGNIAVAFGEERRMERGHVVTDAGAQARLYALGNFTPFYGRYTVRETFAEVEIPLLRDSLVQSLGLSTALRVTDYSTSGHVETWKIGLIGQIVPDLRLRATLSRDVRAPILNELFSTGVATSGSAVDPRTGQNVPIFTFRTGNAALKPEIAKTVSAGAVITPRILPGLSMAMDYYDIRIDDAISTLTSQQVLARCSAGEAIFCEQLQFGGPNGALSQINLFPLNISTDSVRGIDLQADYRRTFAGGMLSLQLIGNYVFDQSQDQLGLRINYAGGIGLDNPVSGMPRARAKFAATLDRGPLSLTAQARFIGAAKLVNGWTGKDVDRNKVPAIAYFDLRGSYRLNKVISLYGTIDNLLDQDPPLLAGTSRQGQNVYYFTATRGDIYDLIGRSYRIGIRATF
jgi:outer membrane receptor protein involved in Fe transport